MGRLYATSGKDFKIKLYDEETNKILSEMQGAKDGSLPGHANRVQCLKFNPLHPEQLLSGSWDKIVYLYDLKVGGPVLAFKGPMMHGDAIDVRLKDGVIRTGSNDPTDSLNLWDPRSPNHPLYILDWNGGLKDY